MNRCSLIRYEPTDQGTFGWLVAGAWSWHSIELPWRGNRPNISCIPAGEYLCSLRNSPRFGRVYQVLDVPRRSHVLIHAANVAGDVSMGYKSDLAGCIAPGRMRGKIRGQEAVLSSRPALREFMAAMGGNDFILEVLE